MVGKMWDRMYGTGAADQPQGPNRAERRARERKTKSAQRRAQRAYNRKVQARTKGEDA